MLKFIVDRLPLILGIVALPISIIALIWALNAGDQITYERVEGDQAVAVANSALERAEENNNSVGTVLSLLEVGLGLLGAIVALAAVIFTLNLRDIRSDLENRAEVSEKQVDQRLVLRETELNQLGEQLRSVVEVTKNQIGELSSTTQQQVDTLTLRIDEQLDLARRRAENAFQVLSLQLLAEQQVRSRNYATAIQTLEEAHKLDDMNQTTNYLLGYMYTARRRFDDALVHLNKALQVDPGFAPALAALGLAQRRIGDQVTDIDERNRQWAEAEVNLLRALKTDSQLLDADGESYFGSLGGLYRRQNRYEDALHAYKQALKVTPTSSYPAGNLAVLYKITGQDEEATQTYALVQEIAEAILDDNPSDHWARLDLAQALLVLGQKDKALQQYRDLIRRTPAPSVLDSGINGLEFLTKSPTPIEGIHEAIQILRTPPASV